MDAGSESWEKNFYNTLNHVAGGTDFSKEGNKKSIDDLYGHLSNRFKSISDIKDFKDQKFFSELALSTLERIANDTGKSPKTIIEEAFDLGKRKNRDYGSDNILLFGTAGIIVRVGDKLKRLNTLKSNKAEVADEKIVDTLMDVFNYAVYGYMLSNDIWF